MNNIYTYKIHLFFLFSLFLLISCSKETEVIDKNNFGYEYFPIQTGKTWTYRSDSIVIMGGGTRRDTQRSFILEQLGSVFKDEFGNDYYKLFRFFRRTTLDPWTNLNSWKVYMDDTKVVRVEENLHFIKMVFPIDKGIRWDGNALIDKDTRVEVGGESIQAYKNWKHKIEDTKLSYSFLNQTVEAIKVNLVSDSSIIDYRKVTEYYGKNIGLLRKEMSILDSDGNKPSETWDKKAQKGFIHTLTLIEVK